MTFSVHGLPVARGIAIGRAVLMASSRADCAPPDPRSGMARKSLRLFTCPSGYCTVSM